MLLNNGLRFVPTPPCITRQQLVSAIQRFQRSVRLRCMFQDTGPLPKYRVAKPDFVPREAPPAVEAYLSVVESAILARYVAVSQQHKRTSNLSTAQAAVLRAFRQQSEHVIKAADKNLGLSLMPADAYHAAVQVHVSDSSVYEDITDRLSAVITSTCSKLKWLVGIYHGCLGDKVSEYLLQGLKMRQPPHLYILPKLHKMASLDGPIVGRPIAACHSWVTTCVSTWLADELNSLLPEYDTVLRDRTQLVREIDGLRVSKDAWLLTFDVESLYPNVDHAGCVAACAAAVHGSGMRRAMVAELLDFVLKNNVVTVQGKYYRQIFGGAMGTNCMPPAAQLYLAREWESIAKQRLGNNFPSLYKRFIDDGFVILEGSKQKLLEFVQLLNSLLPNIRITYSCSQFEVEFLDLVVYKCMEDVCDADGKVRLKVRTHQKALNKYLYIPHYSFHPPSVFRSFINAELIRYVVTNSDEHWFDCMVRKFVHRLRQRGYPQRLLASITSRVSFSQRHRYLSASSSSKAATASSKSVMVVPYAQLMPELQLQQLLRDAYANGGGDLHTLVPERPIVAFTKSRNLGSFLVKASH